MKTYDILKLKKTWFVISGIIIALGLVLSFINGGLNLGIDFTGGTSLQARIGRKFDVQEVKNIMDKYDKEATITYAGNEKDEVIVRTKLEFDDDTRRDLLEKFDSELNVTSKNINFESIGPSIGSELKKQAILALLVANLGILIYISIRFEWRFGLASIFTLLHDVIIMTIFYGAMKIPVNSSFIAAILTIVGYSINATIVIFDRIRENMKTVRRVDPEQVVNNSINQTLARSINTSLTTFITIGTLYILGVPAVKEFALPLIIGLISGTYSSVFLASSVWLFLRNNIKVKSAH
ncbi:MAG: protein translocase subunit SecF [Firmicutes bacterium]|nr:protein translocase subunit SecF [Bacillota bacterium]